MKPILYSLLPLLGAATLSAQSPLQWAQSWGSPAVDEGIDIHTDAQGYTYICGYFSATGDFDPHPERSVLLSPVGSGDAFVQKFDPQGNLVWARSWGSSDWDAGYALTTDAQQNVFVAIKTTNKEQQVLQIVRWSPSGEQGWAHTYLRHPRLDIGDLQFRSDRLLLSFSMPSISELEATTHNLFLLEPESGALIRQPDTWNIDERLFAAHHQTVYFLNNKQVVAYQLDSKAMNWSKPIASPSRLATDAQGNLLVAGKSLAGFYLEKRAAASGNVLWSMPIEGAQRISGLACSNEQIFVSIKTKDAEIALLQYDTDGNFQGMQRIPTTETSDIYNLAAYPQGGVSATGYFSQTMINGLLRPTGAVGANDAFWLRWQGSDRSTNEASTTTETAALSDLSADIRLQPCFPNPASDRTTIVFELPSSQAVELNLYDATGRFVRSLYQGTADGEMQVVVELSDLPPGLYFYQLQSNQQQRIQQLIVKK